MSASNSVSTIFKCISCSFGTPDQAAYAEHIKYCSNESASEPGDKVQNNLSGVCKQCHLPMDCTRALLVHLRDVHREDLQIFVCRFCPRYAARRRGAVYSHVKSRHPGRVLRGRAYCTELHKKCVNEELSADNKANATAHCTSKTQTTSCAENEISISNAELHPVKFSRSLGLQFLGKQHPDIDRDAYICQLCGFSHVVSHRVVKHIWKEHADKFTGVLTETSTRQATDGASMTDILYRCDDCSYSTYTKHYFYNHCAHHQFDGPSKCPHCSYCALTDTVVTKHIQKYHESQHLGDLNTNVSVDKPTDVCTKTSAPQKAAKRSESSPCKTMYDMRYKKKRYRKKKWFTCQNCPYKSKQLASVNSHKARVHAEVSKARRNSSSSDSNKLKKTDVGNSLEISSNCNGAEEQKPFGDKSLKATSTLVKQTVYTCDVCSAKCKSLWHLSIHKEIHPDLRCYQCPLCGLRGNYLGNMKQHINNMHKDGKASVIKLSLEDAKKSIEAYKKQLVKHFHRRGKCLHSSAAVRHSKFLHQTSYGKTKAVHYSMPSLSNHMLAYSTENRMNNSCASHVNTGAAVASFQKCYKCSLCKMQSKRKQNIFRHICNLHSGKKAKVITVKEKISVHKSKLSLQRDTVKSQKHDAATSGNSRIFCSQEGEQKHQQTVIDAAEHDDASGVEFVVENAVKSEMYDVSGNDDNLMRIAEVKHIGDYDPLQPLPEPNPNSGVKGNFHLCEHCPYVAACQKALTCHRQLHHPRASAPYKCKYCAFWVTKPCHLTGHERVHTAKYLQKLMKCSQPPKTSDSYNCDVEMIPSLVSLSDNSKELDMLPAENVFTTDEHKLDKTTHNNLAVNGRDSTDTANADGVAAVAEDNADVLAHSRSAITSRHLSSWCCERCPYSSNKLACFKRHVWLHGKQYPYECRYCDYSVQSFWQLVSHELWHFAPNKHLVYAQSVSNADSFLPQLTNRDNTPDILASVDRYIPSFENSDEFVLSDDADFQCDNCPFVTTRRSEFLAHMLCHSVLTDAYICPYCTFCTDLRDRLSAHIFLHFNLPGCQQSFLPPNVCQSEVWKQLDAAVEAIVQRHSRSACVLRDNYNNWSDGQLESESLLEADDSVMIKNPATRQSVIEDTSMTNSVSTLRLNCNAVDSTHTLSAVPQSVLADDHSVLTDKQHVSVTHSSKAAADSSSVDKPPSADSVTSVLINKTQFCRYCDKVIGDRGALVKHEAGHLTGCKQPVP